MKDKECITCLEQGLEVSGWPPMCTKCWETLRNMQRIAGPGAGVGPFIGQFCKDPRKKAKCKVPSIFYDLSELCKNLTNEDIDEIITTIEGFKHER